MVFELIIVGLMNLLAWIFSLFNFISLPLWAYQGLNNAVDFMLIPFGVITNYVNNNFLSVILVLIITVYPLLYAYLLIKWILQKIGILKGS